MTGVRQDLRWIGAIVAVLTLLEGARRVVADARSARRSARLGLDGHGHDGGHCASGAESAKRSNAERGLPGSFSVEDPWSRKTPEVQLARPLPAPVRGPALVWAVVPASGGRGTSTEAVNTSFGRALEWTCANGDLAQGLYSAKTWWALWQPSSGARWKHVAVRTRVP